MLDFRVRTFLCVCQTMNYTKAAQQLHITQPAVSAHIHYLESYYQIQLFHYQNRKLELTSAGKLLYERLHTMVNDESQLRAELHAPQQEMEQFSLGVTMTIGEYAIVKPIVKLLNTFPHLNLHLHFGNTAQLLNQLKEGTIQMALVEGYYPKDIYVHTHYRTEAYIPVCATNHVFKNVHPHTVKDLVEERILLREKGSGTRNILERDLAVRGMDIEDFHHYVEVENMHTIIDLLCEDCGISFLYRMAAQKQIEAGILKEICLEDFSLQHDLDFIWEQGSLYNERNEKISSLLASV
ncbi:LysR family transcriptional regulator [Absicoccus intestinalis]|uniref:LysR family transcriptional regulator n=1 Tax=Absicoccus intestinalis TaxID=2926319 RepID=A0ABU4WIE9_9FIRM|nr:LysR family transcriptional regulator [Absicoccus sp. CLA-KB-P134]MDX8416330.1 LysR family transcriptional regulator [Absicoccus sp. CLA-KB-P134]